MKTAKKLLSLVLVLVMALSLMNFAMAKPEFTSIEKFSDINDDFSEIQLEAIDILLALGVLEGYPDGSFGPNRTITRAEAAKIMTYLYIGTTAAEKLGDTEAAFKDTAGHWGNKYIAYLKSAGIAAGYGDGNYGPDDEVTGAQMAKMLLMVLGYGMNDEYVGSRWAFNAVSDGQNKGILTTDADYNAAAPRIDVVVYAFNTLRNRVVTYNPALGQYYDTAQVGGTTTYLQTLSEKVFKLFETNSYDEYGRETRVWKLGSVTSATTYGPYNADKMISSFTNGGLIGTTKLGLAAGPDLVAYTQGGVNYPVEYYINGINLAETIEEDYNIYGTTADTKIGYNYEGHELLYSNTATVNTDYLRGSYIDIMKAVYADINAAAKTSGVIVEFYDRNDDGNADKVVTIVNKAGYISSNPVVNSSGTITFSGLRRYDNNTNVFPASTVYDSDIKAGDVVLYHQDGNYVWHITKAEAVTGQYTAYLSTVQQAVFGGNNYYNTDLRLDSSIDSQWLFSNFAATPIYYNKDATLWLDPNGNAIAFILGTIEYPDYLVILRAYASGAQLQADVILADGTRKVVSISSVMSSNGSALEMVTMSGIVNTTNITVALNTGGTAVTSPMEAIYSYSVNADGTSYSLIKPHRATYTNLGAPADPGPAVPYGYSAITASATANLTGSATIQTNRSMSVGLAPSATLSRNTAFYNSATASMETATVNNALGQNLRGDDATVFVTLNGTNISVFTGVANAPQYTTDFPTGEAVTYSTYPNGIPVAKFVFLTGGNLTSQNRTKMMFVNFNSARTTTVPVGTYGYVYIVEYVDTATGTKKEVYLTSDAWNQLNGTSVSYINPAAYKYIYAEVTQNSDGVVTSIITTNRASLNGSNMDFGFGVTAPVTGGGLTRWTAGQTTVDANGVVAGTATIDLIFNSSTKIYKIDTSNNLSVETFDGSSIPTDPNCIFYVLYNDYGQVTEIYIVYRNAINVQTVSPLAYSFTGALTYDVGAGATTPATDTRDAVVAAVKAALTTVRLYNDNGTFTTLASIDYTVSFGNEAIFSGSPLALSATSATGAQNITISYVSGGVTYTATITGGLVITSTP